MKIKFKLSIMIILIMMLVVVGISVILLNRASVISREQSLEGAKEVIHKSGIIYYG